MVRLGDLGLFHIPYQFSQPACITTHISMWAYEILVLVGCDHPTRLKSASGISAIVDSWVRY